MNVCAGDSTWGDVTLDRYMPADVAGDWRVLPFEDDSFGAVFADPPWDSGHKSEVAQYMPRGARLAAYGGVSFQASTRPSFSAGTSARVLVVVDE